MVYHIDMVWEAAALDFELYASGVLALERGPAAETVRSVRGHVERRDRRRAVSGGNVDQLVGVQLRVGRCIDALPLHTDGVVSVVDVECVPSVGGGHHAGRVHEEPAGVVLHRVTLHDVIDTDFPQPGGRGCQHVVAGIHQCVGHLAVVVAGSLVLSPRSA